MRILIVLFCSLIVLMIGTPARSQDNPALKRFTEVKEKLLNARKTYIDASDPALREQGSNEFEQIGKTYSRFLGQLAPEDINADITVQSNEGNGGLRDSKGYCPSLILGYCYWQAALLTEDKGRRSALYVQAYSALSTAYSYNPDAIRFHAYARAKDVYESAMVLRMLTMSAIGALPQGVSSPPEVMALLLTLSDAEQKESSESSRLIDFDIQKVLVNHEDGDAAYDDLKALRDRSKAALDDQVKRAQSPAVAHSGEGGSSRSVAFEVNPIVPIQLILTDPNDPTKVVSVSPVNADKYLTGGKHLIRQLQIPDASPLSTVTLQWKPLKPDGLSQHFQDLLQGAQPNLSIETPVQLELTRRPAGPIDGVLVNGLTAHIAQAKPNDELVVLDAAGKPLQSVVLTQAESSVTLPDFTVPANQTTPVFLAVRRAGANGGPPRVVAHLPDGISIVSAPQAQVAVSLQKADAPEGAPLIRIQVLDYLAPKSLAIDGSPVKMPPVFKRAADPAHPGPDAYVLLLPWLETGGLRVQVTTGAGATVAVSPMAGAPQPVDPEEKKACLDSLPSDDARRLLAEGKRDAAQTAYEALLTQDPQDREAKAALVTLYNHLLAAAQAKADPAAEMEKLLGHAEPIGLSTDLKRLIQQVRDSKPRDVALDIKAFDPVTGLAFLKFRLNGQNGDTIRSFKVGEMTVDRAGNAERFKSNLGEDGKSVGVLIPASSGAEIPISLGFQSDTLNGQSRILNVSLSGAGKINSDMLPAALAKQYQAIRQPLDPASDPDHLPAELKPIVLNAAVDAFHREVKQLKPETIGQAVKDAKRLNELSQGLAPDRQKEVQTALAEITTWYAGATQPDSKLKLSHGKLRGELAFKSPATALQLRIGDGQPIDGKQVGDRFVFDLPPDAKPGANGLEVALSFPDLPVGKAPGMLTLPVETSSIKLTLNVDRDPHLVPYVAPTTSIDFQPDDHMRAVAYSLPGQPDQMLDLKLLKSNGKFDVDLKGMGIGEHDLQIKAWASDADPAQDDPTLAPPVPLKLLAPAVALIVGNDYYENHGDQTRFLPLHHAVDDAKAVYAMLLKLGYQKENIIYVFGECDKNGANPHVETNGTTITSIKEVTLQTLGFANSTLKSRAQDIRAQHCFIYYAGHGTTKIQENGDGANYFVCAGGTDNDEIPVDASAKVVQPKLTAPEGQKPTLICVYDACRAAQKGIPIAPQPILSGVNFFTLYACQADKHSNENSDKPSEQLVGEDNQPFDHGFFTYSMITAVDHLLKAGGDFTVKNMVAETKKVLGELNDQAKTKNLLTLYEPQDIVSLDDILPRLQTLSVLSPTGGLPIKLSASMRRIHLAANLVRPKSRIEPRRHR